MRNTNKIKKINKLIKESYVAVCFTKDELPDWKSFCKCYYPRAHFAIRVFPEDEQIQVLSLKEYMDAQVGESNADGYTEVPLESKIEVFGNVAYVKQSFSMERVGLKPIKMIDIFSLAKISDEWKIISVVSDLFLEE